MKRSEMVKFITTELFYGSLSARVDNTGGMITELAEKDAEAVLKLVEKLGMLPPLDSWTLQMDGDRADPFNIAYYAWEPEE